MKVVPGWTVVFDGRTVVELVASVERRPGCQIIGRYTRELLLRSRIKPAASAVHDLAIIRGEEIGPRPRRTTENILREARRRGLATPSPVAALLLRELFPQDALGYSRIVVFHKPLRDRDHHPLLLTLCSQPDREPKRNLLIALEAYPQTMWKPTDAFVFLASREPVSTFQHRAFYRPSRAERQPDRVRLAWP